MAASPTSILKDWGVRLKEPNQDLRSIVEHIGRELRTLQDGRGFPLVPPAIQGVGNAGGFALQVEQKDGSFDYVKLQNATDNLIRNASTQSALSNMVTSFRAGAPHVRVEVDRSKAETLKVSIGDVFSTLSSYLGSTYVNRFNKFGLTLMVFLQADSQYRTKPEDILKLQVRNIEGKMVPIGALAELHDGDGPAAHQPLQPLSVGLDRRHAGAGLQLGRGHPADGPDLQRGPAAGHRLRMDGDVVPGEPGRQPDHVRVRARHPAGLSLPRRTVRKLDPAARASSSRCRCRWSGRPSRLVRSASPTTSIPRSA